MFEKPIINRLTEKEIGRGVQHVGKAIGQPIATLRLNGKMKRLVSEHPFQTGQHDARVCRLTVRPDEYRPHRTADRLVEDETYQPHPLRRVYIPKKNGKRRPQKILSFDDKLMQEGVRMILEAIYKGSFERTTQPKQNERSPI